MNKKVLDNKCPSCHAPIEYNPTLNKWKCNFCNSEFTLKEMKKYNNASSEEANKKEEVSSKQKDNTNYVKYSCKDCGAEIIADEQTAATFCVYCGNTAILKDKLSNEFAPDKIIPFKNEKKAAIEAFKKLSKGRPLMPKQFNNTKNVEKITGVYIPFWLYDITISGTINATGERIKSWNSGDKHFTKTDIYGLTRTGTMNFKKIPIDGSTRFEDDIMNSIEPFDYKELEDYNHAYLSGFLAEKYDVEKDITYKDASNRALNTATDIFRSTMTSYSSIGIKNNSLAPASTNTIYVLLPVWMVNVKYMNKYYIFAMNGQTGEFIGNIPLDKKKTIIYTISIFVITFIIIIILSYILYLIGVRV